MEDGRSVVASLEKLQTKALNSEYDLQQAADALTLQLSRVKKMGNYHASRAIVLRRMADDGKKLEEIDEIFADVRKQYSGILQRILHLLRLR